jgi:hypothetical protein
MGRQRVWLLRAMVAIGLPAAVWSQVTGLSGWNIFIDPGHSQTENMGVNGYSEAEECLRVGLQLRDLLLSQTDIDTVYMSRTNDQQSVSLYQRTSQANSLGAAWYHSIHSNAGPPNNNTTLLLWGQLYDGTPDPPVGGEAMSAIMIDLLTRGMRIPTIGSWGDCSFYSYTGACSPSWPGPYLHVNRETNMPSELSEEGHHTNPTQNQLDMNAEYKRLLAYTFYWSILEYHGIERPPVGISAGIISDIETGVPINGAVVHLNGETYTTDTYESLFHNYSNNPNELHNGFYFFEGLPSDTLEMIVTAEGYYPDTANVVVVDTFFTFRDVQLLSNVPPRVVNTVPAEGDSAFPAWDPIVITFSRAMNTATVEAAFSITPATGGQFIWTANERQVRFHPDSLSYETDYTVIITDSARDVWGHHFDGDGDSVAGGDFSLNFRTGPADMFPPHVIQLYPPSMSRDIELQPLINLTFDEPIDPASLSANTLEITAYPSGDSLAGSVVHYVWYEHSILSYFPTEILESNTSYIIRLNPGYRDLHGNTETQIQSSRFRTGTAGWEVQPIDGFESNLTDNWWAPQSSGSTTGILTNETYREGNTEITNLLTGSTQALAVYYGWDTTAGAWLIREYLAGGPPRQVLFDTSYVLQVYLFGDGSGNRFRFCVDDRYPNAAAANHEVSPWYTVDWLGWRLVSWDLGTDGTGTWIGDGTLDGTLRFDSIQLTYTSGSPAVGVMIFDDLRLVQAVQAGVETEQAFQPETYRLLPNYPNPFNASTVIEFQLPQQTRVMLAVYDLRGRLVRTLVEGVLPAGRHRTSWNGSSATGEPVASGIYLYRLRTPTEILTGRMLLLK